MIQALTGAIALVTDYYLLIPLSYVMVGWNVLTRFSNLTKDLIEKVL